MSSVLDVDLDYFNLVTNPVDRLHRLLEWANRPVDLVVERHHHVLRRWKALVKRGALTPPTHILHVDEHHDMMDGTRQPNIGNVMRHAMQVWPGCRVYWMAEGRIDDPGDWLEDDLWHELRKRFRMGRSQPERWPRPGFVSVCTSPDFVEPGLLARLLAEVERFGKGVSTAGFPCRLSPTGDLSLPRSR